MWKGNVRGQLTIPMPRQFIPSSYFCEPSNKSPVSLGNDIKINVWAIKAEIGKKREFSIQNSKNYVVCQILTFSPCGNYTFCRGFTTHIHCKNNRYLGNSNIYPEEMVRAGDGEGEGEPQCNPKRTTIPVNSLDLSLIFFSFPRKKYWRKFKFRAFRCQMGGYDRSSPRLHSVITQQKF